jgi:hypothetical protein
MNKHSSQGSACAKPRPLSPDLCNKDGVCASDKHAPIVCSDRLANRLCESRPVDLDDLWGREKQKLHEQMKTKAKPPKDTKHRSNKIERVELGGGHWNIVDYESTENNERRGEEGLEVNWGRERGKDDEGWMLIHMIVKRGEQVGLDDEEWEEI